MDRFYKLKHQNDPVINSLTLKVWPGLHVFLTLRLLWPERWLILRYANVTDVGERSVWHCKLNPLSQLWYGSAFQRGLPGGEGSLCRAGKHTLAVRHMQWEKAEISNTLLHYPTYVTYWWSLTYQPHICHCSWDSAAATDVVRCYFHISVLRKTNTVASSSSEAENHLTSFVSRRVLHMCRGGCTTDRLATSNRRLRPQASHPLVDRGVPKY